MALDPSMLISDFNYNRLRQYTPGEKQPHVVCWQCAPTHIRTQGGGTSSPLMQVSFDVAASHPSTVGRALGQRQRSLPPPVRTREEGRCVVCVGSGLVNIALVFTLCRAAWAHGVALCHSAYQKLMEDHADCSELLRRGLQQLSEVAAVLYNLRGELDNLSSATAHETEKGDLLLNILGSLLQEVGA
jgi:hypothetical protein